MSTVVLRGDVEPVATAAPDVERASRQTGRDDQPPPPPGEPYRAGVGGAEDGLFILVLVAALGCLIAAYDIVLLVLYGASRHHLTPHVVAFVTAALALLVASALADHIRRARQRARRPR